MATVTLAHGRTSGGTKTVYQACKGRGFLLAFKMLKTLVKSRVLGGHESRRLFNFKTRHQPVKLLPGDRFYLGFILRPSVSALDYIQSLIEKNKAVRFTDQDLNAVATLTTEHI